MVNLDLDSSSCKASMFVPENIIPSAENVKCGLNSTNWNEDNIFKDKYSDNSIPNGKSFIEHIFEKYDDVNTNYSNNETPDRLIPKYTQSSTVERTPNSPENYVTMETRSGRKLAVNEGRKDFCEILEHAGINSSNHLANIFSTTKKNKQIFGCSTPIATGSNNVSFKSTPKRSSSFRFSISPLNISLNCNNGLNSPVSPISCLIYNSNCKNFPDSESVKTILLGITCYVDVRTGKENRSETCKHELLSIGAKVERNFTKKVTHVIFKEGRMSTYLKAKKLGIPIVSVIWIEACKLAKGPVDPSLYPPTKIEKYEDDSPFTRMMKRKIGRLRKGTLYGKELKGGSLRLSSSVQNRTKRKAVTDIKKRGILKNQRNNNIANNCNKKLNFIDFDNPKDLGDESGIIPLDVDISEQNNISDSSIFTSFKCNTPGNKKNSATYGVLSKKKKKCKFKSIDNYFSQNSVPCNKLTRSKSLLINNGQLTSPGNSNNERNNDENNKNINNEQRMVVKRRKLFDPSSHQLSNDIPIECVDITYSYPDTPVKKKTNRITIYSENNDNNDCRAVFVRTNDKAVNGKYKDCTTIVFTSIGRVDCTKLTQIVKKLGNFEIEDQVSERTSHVVTNSNRRTINLLRGLARGCWIVQIDWILQSDLASKWLAEEHFELKTFSPAITESRLQRQAFKKSFKMDIFSTCGPIYITQSTKPPTQDLIELVKLCRGKIVTCYRGAKIIIGNKYNRKNDKDIIKVREKWILDSITNYKLLDVTSYIIVN